MYYFDWALFLQYIWPVSGLQNPLIRNGLIATIVVSVIAQVMGVILGLFAALAKMSKSALLRGLADAYIWYFRGTPLLVQMMLLFYGLGTDRKSVV
jgi:His/Glu/Gln/Arg/opine family amino acid ABC transporter permease subunit